MTDKKQIKKMKKATGKGRGTPPLKGPKPVTSSNPKNNFASGGMVMKSNKRKEIANEKGSGTRQ